MSGNVEVSLLDEQSDDCATDPTDPIRAYETTCFWSKLASVSILTHDIMYPSYSNLVR